MNPRLVGHSRYNRHSEENYRYYPPASSSGSDLSDDQSQVPPEEEPDSVDLWGWLAPPLPPSPVPPFEVAQEVEEEEGQDAPPLPIPPPPALLLPPLPWLVGGVVSGLLWALSRWLA